MRGFVSFALLVSLLALAASTKRAVVDAQPASSYYDASTIWDCPVSCEAAGAWCFSSLGGSYNDGALAAVDCVIEPVSGTVLRFGCRCNNQDAATIEIAQIGSETTLAPTTPVPTQLTMTTRFNGTVNGTNTSTTYPTNWTTNVNDTTTTQTTFEQTTTTTETTLDETTSTTFPNASSSNVTLTNTTAANMTDYNTTTVGNTTTTTRTTGVVTLPPVRKCHVAAGAAPYFQRSPTGLFCQKTTGTCPGTCAAARATYALVEECVNGDVQCTEGSGGVVTMTCTPCSGGTFTMVTDAALRRVTTTTAVATAVTGEPGGGGGGGGGGGVVTTTTRPAQQLSIVDVCMYSLTTATSTSLGLPAGTCGIGQCGDNGCCNRDTCSCFGGRPRGFYSGAKCERCKQLFFADAVGLCTLEESAILLLLAFFDDRPSGLLAPVSILLAVMVLLFLFRGRWNSDAERYVIPAGVPLVDPVTGYSVPATARFYIPPRPAASRGIVNRLRQEKLNVERQRAAAAAGAPRAATNAAAAASAGAAAAGGGVDGSGGGAAAARSAAPVAPGDGRRDDPAMKR